MSLRGLLVQSATTHLTEGVSRIEKSFSFLSQEEIWQDPNEHLVSVGNLVLHLCGNVTQYVIAGLGREPIPRDRDGEFTRKPAWTKEALVAQLRNTVDMAIGVLKSCTDSDLDAEYVIQGMPTTGAAVVVHVVEHFSYHVGQITFAVKLLKNLDVGYYAGIDLNQQNSTD
jgi:uncharacterized damage-inducible protein DinB